ncbi:hypothetical protein [Aeoliella sp. SH292]|uniref:hypothetical protein n=1 Tax=Aeoliella sp. SH292 TaxID=3454464 RepID=UPI003F9C5D4F
MSESSAYKHFESAISQQRLERNPLAQLKLALSLLPRMMQSEVACDYTEHWLVDHSPNPMATEIVLQIRQFLHNQNGLGELNRKYWELRETETNVSQTPEGVTVIGTCNMGGVLRMLMLCCCQRELEQASLLVKTRFQPSVFDVSREILSLVSPDKSTELNWQLAHAIALLRGLGSA